MKLKGEPLQTDEGPGILAIPGKLTIAEYCLSKDFVEVSKNELLMHDTAQAGDRAGQPVQLWHGPGWVGEFHAQDPWCFPDVSCSSGEER